VRWGAPVLIIAGGLFLRLTWIRTPAGLPDGDEAAFGLMALHILEGREYPLYLWGAHYAGAVVSYIAAMGFWLFGVSGVVLKSSTLPFTAGYLAVTYGLGRYLSNEGTARVALLLAAIPPAVPLNFSVKALGGYPETLCFGGLVLLMTFSLPVERSPSRGLGGHLAVLGFSGGFGLYILPLILPYVAVGSLFLFLHRRHVLRRGGWAWILAGGLLGASPLLAYNLQFPFATLLRLGSRVLDVSRDEALRPGTDVATGAAWIAQYLRQLPARFPVVLRSLGPLLGFTGDPGILIAWIIMAGATLALWRAGREGAASASGWASARYCALLIPGVLLFAWLTGLNRPRHLVPLYSVLPLGLAALYNRLRSARPWIARAALTVLLLSTARDMIEAARIPSGVPMAPLIQAAERLGVRGVYTDYDIAYRLMFATREAILASPTAWPQGVISDRTPEVTRQVDHLPNPAYVFLLGTPEAGWFAQGLVRRGIRFTRNPVGPFELFTDLSAPVRSAVLPVGSEW